MTASYIYFIRADIKNGPIKIGFTTGDPRRRKSELQIGCPWPIKILGAIKGSAAQEKQIHLVLARWRTQGEWFEPHRIVRAAVKEALKCGEKIEIRKARAAKYDHPLCRYREKHGLSLKDIASRTGLGDTSLSHIESRQRLPSAKAARAIIEATDLTLSDLRPDIARLLEAAQ